MSENFNAWIETVPNQLRLDPLWKSVYYRLSMYLYDLVWQDSKILGRDFRGKEIAKQLIRSVGRICANLEEAYGRGIRTADHVRVLCIALGEARESQGWYFRARHILSQELLEERARVINQIIALLIIAKSLNRKSNVNTECIRNS